MNSLLNLVLIVALGWFLWAHLDHEKLSRFRGELRFHRVEMGR
jgi:hypothetical protein